MTTYRFGTLDDMPAFETMLRAYLMEQEATGSKIRFTRRTLDAYRDLGAAYMGGSRFGGVILAVGDSPVGFTLVGEDSGSWLDHGLGKTVAVWISWVDPLHRKEGHGLGMLLWGRPQFVEWGFETATMSVRETNPEGQGLTEAFGARLVERVYHFPIAEEPGHGRIIRQ